MRNRLTNALRLLLAGMALALIAPPLLAAGEGGFDTQLAFKGRSVYGLYCRSCHGAEGKGDGTVAEVLKITPADLTQIAARRDGVFPKEEIHAMIDGRKGGVRGHGAKDMPVWGDAFKKTDETADEAQVSEKIDALVNFLISIQESSK